MRRAPFIPKKRLERAAEKLLLDFGSVSKPPVPVEDILERHLGFALTFADLAAIFERGGVLGATWMGSREVVIDQQLDPDVHPESEGRFRFTLAHEIGHCVLHGASLGLLPTTLSTELRLTKNPIEWQADYFASCLLMPRELLLGACEQFQGSTLMLVPCLAQRFEVSEQALQIRLAELGVSLE
jgi:hypothetical protein